MAPDSKWPEEAWDVLFNFQCPADASEQLGTIEYCNPKAPHTKLVAGTEFQLMEGARPAVQGVVL
jgi:hypothetical protein